MGDTEQSADKQQPADDEQAVQGEVPPEPQEPATQDSDDDGVKPDTMWHG